MALQDFGLQKLSLTLRERMNAADARAREEAYCPVIIEVIGRSAPRLSARIEANKGRICREMELIPAIAAELPLKALAELSRMVGVMRIWEDAKVYAMLDRVTPNLGASQAHEGGYTGKGVVIAVLDSGVFPHLDLTTPENRILAWHDLLDNRPDPYDDNGHGTHIAGVIAGNGLSSQGRYCGIAPEARLVAVKVLNQDGVGRLSDLIAGLEWCLIHQATLNIKVINLSLGTTAQADYPLDPLCRAAAMAVQRGVTVCASCGKASLENQSRATAAHPGGAYYPNGVISPSMSPRIIAVGNYDGQKTFSGAEIVTYQNSGPASPVPKPDLVAPGMDITAIGADGDYRTLSGSSAAASLVTGAIALILQKWPSLQPERIKGLLKKNARNLGVGVNLQGAGLLSLGEIFGLIRKKAAKSEAPRGPYDEIFKILWGMMGQNTATANPSGELFKNIILSLMKGFK